VKSAAWGIAENAAKIMLANRLRSCFDSGVIPVLEREKSVQKNFEKSLTLDTWFVILRSHTETNKPK
jgi:hypothetical protein